MEIGPHVEALQNDLAAVAAVGDEAASETVHRIATALQASVRLRLLDVVTEVASELTAQLPSEHVEVRLAGGEPSLIYVGDEREPGWASPGDEPATARITLRLPEGLKASVEAAAQREGVSVNTWLVQAISRSIDPRPTRGRRITGFARS